MEPTQEFKDATAELGLEFESGDLDRLSAFLGRMLDVNKTHNLTAITDPAQAWMKHIFDAMTLVPVIASISEAASDRDGLALADAGPRTLVDIGSGGGVPGIPLAIVVPEIRMTLVEATGKKVLFLREVIAELGLKNVEVLQDRAERLGQDHRQHRERYDLGTARALGHLAVVAELLGPLVKPGGTIVAVKGQKADQELQEAHQALGLIGLRHTETLPTPTGRLVVLEKTIRTPRLYPRKDGEPARLPLGMDRPAKT